MYLKFMFARFCISALLFAALPAHAQDARSQAADKKDSLYVKGLIKESATHFSDDRGRALRLAEEAIAVATEINYPSGKAYGLKNIGIVYYFEGRYLEALSQYHQSLKIFHDIKDNVGISNLYSNIGAIYYNQADYARALENHLLSLQYAEKTGDKLRILTALNNVGAVYYIKPATREKALDYYLKALVICEETDNKPALGAIAVNIGTIYFDRGNAPEAAKYNAAQLKEHDTEAEKYFNRSLQAYGEADGSQYAYIALGKLYSRRKNYDAAQNNLNRALALSGVVQDDNAMLQTLYGLGKLYVAKGKPQTALDYFRRAENMAVTMPANDDIKDLYKAMADTYDAVEDYHNAYKYQALFSGVKDSIYNIATDKKLASLQFDFDLQKKEGEISMLTKDKALNELKIKKQAIARNAFAIGLVLVFFIAALIFRNYRVKVKTNKLLDKQKEQIEQLLLNILPAEVARELQDSGRSIPREYESVSVLFTDFKSFTRITSNMPPQELVEELNGWFMAFDNIIARYNLEKIKTIGDSYMCAGGIPTPSKDHPYQMVKAGLEIQEHITSQNKLRVQQGLLPWDLRIGIHVGPAVAGVVGRIKYAYDIWGSTVNIASRMESNSEPGQVNISAQTYELVKDRFSCSYRGKIYAKNVGEIDMYFVHAEMPAQDHATGQDVLQNAGISAI